MGEGSLDQGRSSAAITPDDTYSLRGGGLGALREHNRAAALRLLLDRGPLSRTDLAGLLHLSQPAISYIVADLVANGLVEQRPAPPAVTTGPGRHAVPLILAPAARFAIGVHIGATGLDIGLVDLRAQLVDKRVHRIDHTAWGPAPSGLVCAVAASVQDLLRANEIDEDEVLGVGVGGAGWVDGEAGLVRHHAQLGWHDVPLAHLLGQALALPVALDEHVRSVAVAEAWFGVARHRQSFALLYVGAILGCSIVFGRRPHRGRLAAAGVIGGLPAWPEPPAEASDGETLQQRREHTTLEDAVSEPAVAHQATAVAAHHPDSAVARWLRQASAGAVPRSDHLAQEILLEEASTQDRPALMLLQERAAALAPYVAQVIATYDPDLFVVAGPIAWDDRYVQLQLLREAIRAHAPALTDRLPEIVPSALGSRGAMAGAGALILRELYSPPLAGDNGAMDAVAAEIRRRAWPDKHKDKHKLESEPCHEPSKSHASP